VKLKIFDGLNSSRCLVCLWDLQCARPWDTPSLLRQMYVKELFELLGIIALQFWNWLYFFIYLCHGSDSSVLMQFLVRWRGIIRDVPSSVSWPAKQERLAGVGRRSLLRRSSQSSVCIKRRERERELERIIDSPKWFLYSLLYLCMLYVHFAPVKPKAQWRRLISSLTWFDLSHKYWRLPATKVHVRGLIFFGVRNPTCGANLAPLQSGDKYFPNNLNKEDPHDYSERYSNSATTRSRYKNISKETQHDQVKTEEFQ
jgi:hypothetical protein